ncbi:helix-turn-helix transcriptional regulator [Flavobacteriaceae bacterium]|nr:helix-turn-helix transcriptional regulator [Flavobacteriaceae bacterium]
MGKDHKKLLNNLEQLRRVAGLTQQELSVAAEVSRKSINAIENGVYVPSTVLALKISKTLNCSVEDLFKLPYLHIKNYLDSL